MATCNGTTLSGGAGNHGTLFEITPGGALTTVLQLLRPRRLPRVQDTNCDLHGTTMFGGPVSEECAHLGCGTVFRLSVRLGPFVKTLPHIGCGHSYSGNGSDRCHQREL